MELKDLKSYNYLEQKDSSLASQVNDVYELTKETINGISKHYDNYTMHDMNHGLRVAKYMEQLAFGLDETFEKNIKEFNALEIAMIILSAILHDIGMFIRPEDIDNIKNNKIKYCNNIDYNGVLKLCKSEDEAVKEIIRITHADRINEFINYNFNGKSISNILLVNNKYCYADDIVMICQGHGRDYSYLKNLRIDLTKGNYKYNLQYITALLRIADLLDLDRQRTPILWYSVMNIDGFSKEEWEKHFIIQNEKKLKNYMNGKLQIYFDGKSENAKIHRKYLKYIDNLRIELENADRLLNTALTEQKYIFNISTKIDDCVQTIGFKYSDLRLNLDYSSITNLLMGNNIYGDEKLGLRELIQNSIDACCIMNEVKKMQSDIYIEPMITISYSKKHNYIKIKDTGIGMTLETIQKHFLNVGQSYYKSREYLFNNYNYGPIGNFGIGFLACFLLSDNVIVKTRHYNSNDINQIELEKNSEYVVTNVEETGYFFGTEITLNYTTFFNVFRNEEQMINFIERYFYTSIPIYVINEDNVFKEKKQIKNLYIDYYENIIKDGLKNKQEIIDCEKYSKFLNGYLIVNKINRKFKQIINDLDYNSTYLFDNLNKNFKLINENNIEEGYYYIIKYANIPQEDYQKIIVTKKSGDRKRIEIFSVAKAKKKEIYLLIKKQDKIDYIWKNEVEDISFFINGKELKSILQDSNLNYYPELLDYENVYDIFLIDKYFTYLHCLYLSKKWSRHNPENRLEFNIYNKGILINDIRGIMIFSIFPLQITGSIGYLDDDLKLDVSRNKIIAGRNKIEKEVENVIMRYYLENKHYENDERIKKILEKILCYDK